MSGMNAVSGSARQKSPIREDDPAAGETTAGPHPIRSPSSAPRSPAGSWEDAPATSGSAGTQRLVQQFIRRVAPPPPQASARTAQEMPSTKLANRYEARVREHPALQTLSRQDQQALLSIVQTLRDGPEALRLHYLPQLVVLLETPYVKRDASNPEERDVHRRVDAGLRAHRDAVAAGAIDPSARRELVRGRTQFVRRVGQDGKTFLVDATRLDAVVVKIKVKFNFVHCDEMRTKIPALEDAIEKACRARGYDVDLVLTQRSGPDVFEVNVDDRSLG